MQAYTCTGEDAPHTRCKLHMPSHILYNRHSRTCDISLIEDMKLWLKHMMMQVNAGQLNPTQITRPQTRCIQGMPDSNHRSPISESPNSELRTPISELRSQSPTSPNSELRTPISYIQSPISDLRIPNSDLRSPISDISELRSPISDLRSPNSELQTPICYIQSPISDPNCHKRV